MKNSIRFFWLVLVVIALPAGVFAGTLDDYYLSRLVPGQSAHLLSGIASAVQPHADRCLTGVRHQAKLDWNKLQPATQKTLAKVLARPTLSGEQTYSSVHFTIHYATTGNATTAYNAPPDLTDADGNGVPDWVETVAATFEHVWDVEVNQMGFQAPPGGRYNVYLENLVPESVYGYTSDDVAVTTTSYSSYIEIDRAFTNNLYTHASGGPFTPEFSLQITAAHEFHHAIQYGYNYYFQVWFAEMTSTWMEDEVYPGDTQIYSYLADYLPYTASIAVDSIDANSEYGRWIFNRYLAEKFGGTDVVKAIWDDLRTKPRPFDGSDIPMTPVIDEVLASSYGSSFDAEVFGFARKLALRNWTSHPSEKSLIYTHGLDTVYVTGFPSSGITVPNPTLPAHAFVYYQYTAPQGNSGSFTFDFTGFPAALSATVVRENLDGSMDEFARVGTSPSLTVPSFPYGSQLDLVIVNASDTTNTGTSTPGNNGNNNNNGSTTTTSGSKSGGGCFIATAAYGSYLHPKVAELRHFRDHFLLTNLPGRLFVALYYKVSPPIAHVIAEHGWMRAGVRVMLTPMILAVEHPAGALFVVLLMPAGALLVRRRRAGLAA